MAARIALVAGVRTPFLKAGSVARELPAYELGRQALVALQARLNLKAGTVDEVVFGCVANPPNAANVARVIALRAGLDRAIPARTVSRNCASGMEAITAAAEKILAGQSSVAVVGGAESMSQAPLLWPQAFAFLLDDWRRAKTLGAKWSVLRRLRPALFTPRVGLLEGLTDPVCGMNMGQTAEVLAREFGLSRAAQDAFACESHRRAEAATASGRLAEEIVPLYVPPRYEPIAADNGIRPGQTVEALARLRPFFDARWGTVTAGNSSQITDGAVALLVTTEERAQAEGWAPLGYLRAWAYAGLDPRRMGLGPVFATARALDRASLTLADVELAEINEAFAAQVLACLAAFESPKFAADELGRGAALGRLDPARLNVNGGAIALGHPVGASGARLALTLLLEMRRRGLGLGLAALCIGGGQGAALLFEGAR